MMPCTEFEELLADYEALGAVERARVDAHMAHCEACRGWREAFVEADAALRATYAGVRAPATLAAFVRQRIPHPVAVAARVSLVPEILDFIAWTGVLCACGLLAYFWLPRDAVFSQATLLAISGILLCAALSATIWVLSSSES
ncbi:MAG: zf-HC2 domain-containing protein [Bryobacteraceae bacterium]|jgi:anti-sigma factor RsiW